MELLARLITLIIKISSWQKVDNSCDITFCRSELPGKVRLMGLYDHYVCTECAKKLGVKDGDRLPGGKVIFDKIDMGRRDD